MMINMFAPKKQCWKLKSEKCRLSLCISNIWKFLQVRLDLHIIELFLELLVRQPGLCYFGIMLRFPYLTGRS